MTGGLLQRAGGGADGRESSGFAFVEAAAVADGHEEAAIGAAGRGGGDAGAAGRGGEVAGATGFGRRARAGEDAAAEAQAAEETAGRGGGDAGAVDVTGRHVLAAVDVTGTAAGVRRPG